MTLMDKLIAIYPELTEWDFVSRIVIADRKDGNGEVLVEWNHPTLAKPTDEELANV